MNLDFNLFTIELFQNQFWQNEQKFCFVFDLFRNLIRNTENMIQIRFMKPLPKRAYLLREVFRDLYFIISWYPFFFLNPI